MLRQGVEDEADNITRFVWVAPEGTVPSGSGPWRTSLVFSELGEDHPGALVDALQVFSDRAINLTRIESRPLRRGLGRYQFFIDIEGASADEPLAEAIETLRSKAETVRVLGSWPISTPPGVPGGRVGPALQSRGNMGNGATAMMRPRCLWRPVMRGRRRAGSPGTAMSPPD